eukprot:11516323-Heterocapsa_arctica.AAC.1
MSVANSNSTSPQPLRLSLFTCISIIADAANQRRATTWLLPAGGADAGSAWLALAVDRLSVAHR